MCKDKMQLQMWKYGRRRSRPSAKLSWALVKNSAPMSLLLERLELNSKTCNTVIIKDPNTFNVLFFQSSCVSWRHWPDYSDDSWRGTFFGKHEHGALWLLICGAIKNTYLLTYCLLHKISAISPTHSRQLPNLLHHIHLQIVERIRGYMFHHLSDTRICKY